MKFNDAKNIKEKQPEKISTKKNNNKYDQYNLLDTITRYGSVGVYVMKPGKKGLFKEISTYAHDGTRQCTWSLKLAFIEGNWTIQFGINPNVSLKEQDIHMTELFAAYEEKFEYIKVSGNSKMVLITGVEDRKEAEEISNYIINTFENVELDLNDDSTRDIVISDMKKPFKIIGFFPDDNSDSTEKFDEIINKLESIRLGADDEYKLNIIKRRLSTSGLREKDKNTLNSIMKDYFSTHDRVSIAMKYLKKD